MEQLSRVIASLLLLMFLVSAPNLHAQGVSIHAMPRTQVQTPYGTTYYVKANVTNGFNKSIFLRAYSPTSSVSDISVTPTFVNYPYTDSCAVTVYTSGGRTAGTYPIIIEGSNGPLLVLDTVEITVTERPAWRTYDTHNSPLTNSDISAVAVDSNGVGWVGTGRELARFDGVTWTLFPELADGIQYFGVYEIEVSPTGSVWVLCSAGLMEYRDSVWHKHKVGGTDMVFASDGTLWSATTVGLSRYDGTNVTLYDPSNSPVRYPLYDVVIDGSGTVWTHTSVGLYGFDGTYWSQFDRSAFGLKQGYFSDLGVDQDGDLWVISKTMVAEFDGTNFTQQTASNLDTVFPGRCPERIVYTATGTTWISQGDCDGLNSAGLSRFVGTQGWHYNTENSDLPGNVIQDMTVDKNNTLWIATRDGLALLDGNAAPIRAFDPTEVSDHTISHALSCFITGISPNPIQNNATSDLSLTVRTQVRISVLNLLGQEIKLVCNDVFDEGARSISFDASALSGGSYIVRMIAGDVVETKQLIVNR